MLFIQFKIYLFQETLNFHLIQRMSKILHGKTAGCFERPNCSLKGHQRWQSLTEPIWDYTIKLV